MIKKLFVIILLVAIMISIGVFIKVKNDFETDLQSENSITTNSSVSENSANNTLPGGVEQLTEEELENFGKENGNTQNDSETDNSVDFEDSNSVSHEGVELNVASPDGSTDYEKYISMSGEEQLEFFNSFEDPSAFFEWLDNARAEFEALYPGVDIGDGQIDIGDYIDPGN